MEFWSLLNGKLVEMSNVDDIQSLGHTADHSGAAPSSRTNDKSDEPVAYRNKVVVE